MPSPSPGGSGAEGPKALRPKERSRGLQSGWPQLLSFNRSATDPVGHEVIWALKRRLQRDRLPQVAPLHPWWGKAAVGMGRAGPGVGVRTQQMWVPSMCCLG